MKVRYTIGRYGSLFGKPIYEITFGDIDQLEDMMSTIVKIPSKQPSIFVVKDADNHDFDDHKDLISTLKETYNCTVILVTTETANRIWDLYDHTILIIGIDQYDGQIAGEVWLEVPHFYKDTVMNLPRKLVAHVPIWILADNGWDGADLLTWVMAQPFPVRVCK